MRDFCAPSDDLSTQKCWVVTVGPAADASEIALWELRRVLHYIWGEKVEVARLLRQMREEVDTAMSVGGLFANDEIVPSFKSWKATHGAPAPPPACVRTGGVPDHLRGIACLGGLLD